VLELLGLDNRADADDLTACDIERHDADQPLLCVEIERSRAAVDLGRRNDTSGRRATTVLVSMRAI
jgi:hypothetical protein